MPRQSRIDAFGALHHVIVRGIDRQAIFLDDTDRDRFIDRLGNVLSDTDTRCLAWTLIPSHFHLLLKTGTTPLSTVMRRLLTGHAIAFNRRHKRWGHLFQNRYRSILCQEETYLLELVRYIHLNPLRAGLVEGLEMLERYKYAGHSVLLGHWTNDWQDIGSVLRRFGERYADARRKYSKFVEVGANLGNKPELTGGGLIRSAGGWTALKKLRQKDGAIKGDERILGDSEFVNQSLQQAGERLERKYRLRSKGYDIDTLAGLAAELMNVPVEQLFVAGKNRRTVRARSLLCYWAVRECGMTMSSLANKLDMSSSAVSQSVKRGAAVAAQEKYQLPH